MTLDEIRKIARERGIKAGKAKKSDLVRLIQQAEGNPQCFDTDSSRECGQECCLWRGDCA